MHVSSLPKLLYLETDRPRFELATSWIASERSTVKPAFHDTDTDIFADILARTVARMSVSVSVSVVECRLYITQATIVTAELRRFV